MPVIQFRLRYLPWSLSSPQPVLLAALPHSSAWKKLVSGQLYFACSRGKSMGWDRRQKGTSVKPFPFAEVWPPGSGLWVGLPRQEGSSWLSESHFPWNSVHCEIQEMPKANLGKFHSTIIHWVPTMGQALCCVWVQHEWVTCFRGEDKLFHCRLLQCDKYPSTKDLSVLSGVREDKRRKGKYGQGAHPWEFWF